MRLLFAPIARDGGHPSIPSPGEVLRCYLAAGRGGNVRLPVLSI